MNTESFQLRLIHDRAHDGVSNMAIDEFLLCRQIERKDPNSILRFYHFSEPTMTIGYGMWRSAEHQMKSQVPLVRRVTGGGVVLHGISDLTYSLVVPISKHKSFRKVMESYYLIHNALKEALNHFEIPAELFDQNAQTQGSSFCFDSPVLYDVMLSGKKVAGAGQKRTLGYLLHQGSIAWKVLSETRSAFSEAKFSKQFSICLSESLGLNLNEIAPNAEEIKEAIIVI